MKILISPYLIPGIIRKNIYSDLINRVEVRFDLPDGSITKRQYRKGKPRLVNGKNISVYRAAIAQKIKELNPVILQKDIAQFVGVSKHDGVSTLLSIAESYEFTKDKEYLEIKGFINGY